MISKLIIAMLIIGQAFGEYDEVNLSIKCEARPACACDMAEVESLKEMVQNFSARLESYHRSIPCQFRADNEWFGVSGSNGNCFQYKKTATAQNWHRSRELCQAEGGDLAYLGIRSDNVKRNVISNVAENDAVWIGLNDIRTERTFMWIDGSRLQSSDLTWIALIFKFCLLLQHILFPRMYFDFTFKGGQQEANLIKSPNLTKYKRS